MKKLFLLMFFAAMTALNASVPSTLSWQGILQDDNGDLLNGQYTLITKIYDAQTGGNLLWSETQTVTIEDGITNLTLGKNTTINLDFENQYWLEITIGSGNPLSRIELTSVPYAFTSKNIEDKAVTYDKLQDASGNSGTILMWNGSEWDEASNNDSDAVIGNEVIGNADGTLVRSGTGNVSNPYKLDVAPKGIDTPELDDDAVTTNQIDDYTILEQDIAYDQVVFSIGKVDRINNDVYLVEGPNIKIDDNTPIDGDIKISAIIPNKFNANFVIVNNIGDTVAIFKNDSVVINKRIYIYGKSYHYDTEYFYDGIEHPLDNGGKLVINKYGLFIYNEAGEILIRFDENGSLHNVPETYNDDIIRNHPDGSTTTVDDNGITQRSPDGNRTTTSTPDGFKTAEELDDGSVNETENTPTGTKNKTTDPEGNEIVKTNIGQDEDGNGMLEIYDKDGNLIFKVNKDGSYHNVPEYFYHSTVVTNEAGDTTTTTIPGKTTTEIVHEDGSKNTTTVTHTGTDVTFTDPDGLEKPVSKLGRNSSGNGELELYDSEGNLIYKVNEYGSYHNVVEYFNEGLVVGDEGFDTEDGNGWNITPYGYLQYYTNESPLFDYNPEMGLTLYDYEGNITSQFTPSGSTHNTDEIFNGGITIPTTTGGNIKLDENGIEIEDESGNTKTKFNNDGTSGHFGLETYHDGINIPQSEGGSIDILPPDAPLPGLSLKGSGDIVIYKWDLDSWDSHLPSTFHSDVTHNSDIKLQIEDPEDPPKLQMVDSFFDVFFEINNQNVTSSLPFELTGDFECNGEVTLGDNLSVSGNATISNRLFVDANPWDETALIIDQDGQTLGAIAGFWAEWSDARLKENLVIIPDAIDKVKLINGYYYNLKNDENKIKKVGVIAQEIEKVLPELVHEDENGYKNVEYSKLTALLIEAVKEQQKMIDELNKKIGSQKSQIQAISELKQENEKLNSQMQDLYEVIYKINAKLENEDSLKTVKLTEGE